MTQATGQYGILSLNSILLPVCPHAAIGWPKLLLNWWLQNQVSLGVRTTPTAMELMLVL